MDFGFFLLVPQQQVDRNGQFSDSDSFIGARGYITAGYYRCMQYMVTLTSTAHLIDNSTVTIWGRARWTK